ncbi:hypothetical protein SAMN04488505_1021092 [Chitinophaga rupis]|uniref:Uncharacterized protein n=1 Tax=Chitinophaga rupis TaxID=573321 RepID=A0A1H7T0N8_9BACT|nr:hypothetical protein SAMN04488505_1021092 [Chitinophaga rupis]
MDEVFQVPYMLQKCLFIERYGIFINHKQTLMNIELPAT